MTKRYQNKFLMDRSRRAQARSPLSLPHRERPGNPGATGAPTGNVFAGQPGAAPLRRLTGLMIARIVCNSTIYYIILSATTDGREGNEGEVGGATGWRSAERRHERTRQTTVDAFPAAPRISSASGLLVPGLPPGLSCRKSQLAAQVNSGHDRPMTWPKSNCPYPRQRQEGGGAPGMGRSEAGDRRLQG
jgi:hypothetical protein